MSKGGEMDWVQLKKDFRVMIRAALKYRSLRKIVEEEYKRRLDEDSRILRKGVTKKTARSQ